MKDLKEKMKRIIMEELDQSEKFGQGSVSKMDMAKDLKQRSADAQKQTGIDSKERAIIKQIEASLQQLADLTNIKTGNTYAVLYKLHKQMQSEIEKLQTQNKGTLNEQVQIQTVGQLKDAIKAAHVAIRNPKAKEQMEDSLKNLAVALLKDAIPGGNTIGAAIEAGMGVAGVLKAVYSADDSKNISPGLKSLNVDDELSAVVDDKVELQFLKNLAYQFQRFPDDTPISGIDINSLLSNFIKREYDNTTVTR